MTVSAAELRTPPPIRRKRRAWPWVVLGIVLLLGGVAIAADVLARGWAEGLVAARVAEALDVPDGTPVDVQLGGGSLLVQALAGSIDQVDIRIDDLALGPLRGDLALTAQGVPLDMSSPTRTIAVSYRIPAAGLDGISEQLSGVPIDDVALDGTEIVASGSLSVFGQPVAVGIGLTPAAVDGALGFTPTSVRLGDDTIDAAQLASDPIWGRLAETILQQRTVCIADQLPSSLVLTGAEVAHDELRIDLDASGAALGGSGFTTKGSCPA